MPWGWAPRHEARAQSHAEPSSTKPWKEHEAQVLKRLLVNRKGRFNTGGFPNDVARFVYLQEQARAGVREETEADLVHGFRAWLQGTHSENTKKRTDTYENKPDGRPHRRKMDGTRYDTEKTDWQSTPWGDAQLTHLPGVREWLREEAIATDKADLEMQLLAEYGPHDIESAWRYYKHWVLKRPISYPHAHAQLSDARATLSERGDYTGFDGEGVYAGLAEAGWHGPGMQGPYNPQGAKPRRSTHFDALPEPPRDGSIGERLAAAELLRPVIPPPPAAYSATPLRGSSPVDQYEAAQAAAALEQLAAEEAEAAQAAAALEQLAAEEAEAEYQAEMARRQAAASPEARATAAAAAAAREAQAQWRTAPRRSGRARKGQRQPL